MDFKDQAVKFRGSELAKMATERLAGVAEGIIADGRLEQSEVETFYKALVRASQTPSPLVLTLLEKTEEILADGVVDVDEARELFDLLQKFVGDDSELGELAKPTNLPLCDPAPAVVLEGKNFCLTGTFEFGNRKSCQTAIADVGGRVTSGVTKSIDYLVIGHYVTSSWKHEKFGTKIEQAMEYRDRFGRPKIISEAHWRQSLESH